MLTSSRSRLFFQSSFVRGKTRVSRVCYASSRQWSSYQDDDDPYRRTDDIVYTNEYWSTVKRLDNSWNHSLSNIINDGKYLSDMIERKWGKKYKCELSQDNKGNIVFMILPFVQVDGDEEEYYDTVLPV